MTHKRKKKAPAKRKQTTRQPKIKLSIAEKQNIVRQFLTPTQVASKTRTNKKVAASWLKSKKLTEKAEKKISKLASEILASEKRKASKEHYKLPPENLLFKSEFLKRKNFKSKKIENSDNLAFTVPAARTESSKQKSNDWLDWARKEKLTVRVLYKVGESGLDVNGEEYPAEQLSTRWFDLGKLSAARYERFKLSLTDDKGRHVLKFIVLQ